MRSNNMFGYAGAPMPLPRLRPPGPGTISHAFRTPESSTSEEEDRTDLLGRSFQTSRPKSRSSLAVSMTTFDIPESAARFGHVFVSNIIYRLKGLNIQRTFSKTPPVGRTLFKNRRRKNVEKKNKQFLFVNSCVTQHSVK